MPSKRSFIDDQTEALDALEYSRQNGVREVVNRYMERQGYGISLEDIEAVLAETDILSCDADVTVVYPDEGLEARSGKVKRELEKRGLEADTRQVERLGEIGASQLEPSSPEDLPLLEAEKALVERKIENGSPPPRVKSIEGSGTVPLNLKNGVYRNIPAEIEREIDGAAGEVVLPDRETRSQMLYPMTLSGRAVLMNSDGVYVDRENYPTPVRQLEAELFASTPLKSFPIYNPDETGERIPTGVENTRSVEVSD